MPTIVILVLIAFLGSANFQPTQAQQTKNTPRIGYLEPASEGSSAYDAFLRGLRDLGYVEGKNIAIEHRFAERGPQLRNLAKELVQLKVDVIVTRAGASRAAQRVTDTIPIVFAYSGDPIEAGLATSLPNPGKNLTGIAFLAYELVGKRIELLKETVPSAALVAVLANPGHPGEKREFNETERAARALGVDLRYHRVRNNQTDFDTAFDSIVKEKANALVVFPESVTMAHRKKIIEFAVKHRLPSVFGWKEFVEDGGLMSYGPSRDELYRRNAFYVDKILKGAKPTDLPVELPKKFEFIINLKAAKQIGLTIPPNVLARADRVIR